MLFIQILSEEKRALLSKKNSNAIRNLIDI